jgi:hypothetical protein
MELVDALSTVAPGEADARSVHAAGTLRVGAHFVIEQIHDESASNLTQADP